MNRLTERRKGMLNRGTEAVRRLAPFGKRIKGAWDIFMKQCFVPAIFCYLFVELCSRKWSVGSLLLFFLRDPFVFFYNVWIIAATASIALLFRRRTFVLGLVFLAWATIGVTDMVLLSFRTTPFTAVDLRLIKDALQVMHRYLSFWKILLIAVALIAAISFCVYLFRHGKKAEEKPDYVLRIPFCLLLVWSCFILTELGLSVKLLDRNFGNLANAFHENGLPYCFMNSILNTGVEKPDSYSDETVHIIMEEIGKQPTQAPLEPEDTSFKVTPPAEELPEPTQEPQESLEPEPVPAETLPNVIFLQLESFFDPKYMENTAFTEDPVPYFTYLKENYSSGFLSVPSVGAGTANTEFEVITGMNMDFFGPGEYPYKTILKETTCESMAYNLKKLGYAASAIHNNDGTFYGRNEVFSNLGFDRFDSIEYMSNVQMNPLNWADDSVLTQELLKILELTPEKDYIYAISVQGHGAYPEEPLLSDPVVDVRLPEELSTYYYQYVYYLNQIREMDSFLQELTMFLNAYPEEVVLVLYGDHLPSLGLTEDALKNSNLYETEYVIWSNFPMEREEQDMEAYQLSAYVCERLEIEEGILTKYHQTRQGEPDYRKNLQVLMYDMLYGERKVYNGTNPYEPTELSMGTVPIRISEVFTTNNQGTTMIYLRGEGFTEWSRIALNGEEAETVFLSDTLLATAELPEGAEWEVTVRQQGSDGIILSETDAFTYHFQPLVNLPEESEQDGEE